MNRHWPFSQSYWFVLFAALLFLSMSFRIQSQTSESTALRQPAAPIHNVTDTYFGVSVQDPYRYMEDLKNPDVSGWIKAQADYTEQVLAAIPGRSRILDRMRELDASVPERVNIVQVLPGPVIFYEKRLPDEDVPHLYMRKGLGGKEILLVNPEASLSKGAPHLVLSYSAPSQDGRYVTYGISPGGSEDAVLHVLDTSTMRETGESIDRTQYSSPSFLADGKSFTYMRLQKLGPKSDSADRYLNAVNYLHVVGSPPDADKPVFGNGIGGVSMAPSDLPFVVAIPGSRYAWALSPTESRLNRRSTPHWKKIWESLN
jgi:prolyl oligopeptidase